MESEMNLQPLADKGVKARWWKSKLCERALQAASESERVCVSDRVKGEGENSSSNNEGMAQQERWGTVRGAGKERASLSNRCLTCPGIDAGWGEEMRESMWEREIERKRWSWNMFHGRQMILDQLWVSLCMQGPVEVMDSILQAKSKQPTTTFLCFTAFRMWVKCDTPIKCNTQLPIVRHFWYVSCLRFGLSEVDFWVCSGS